ncbi:MAG: purine-binding chemotaxis protein CheW [Deltaproteobacteria bacterium]|nr:purine-binding chemotaxis protein CheW [Deltaproteobacteria bacterium]
MDLVEIRKKAKKAKKAKKSRKETKPKNPPREKPPAGPIPEAPDHVEEAEVKESAAVAVEAPVRVRNSGVAVGSEPGDLREVLMSQHRANREEEEEERIQVLTFLLAGEEYGLNIMDIKEIVRPKDPTEVPRTPHYVLGIISLRGMIVPIFDVRKRLGLTSTELNPKNRIIVVNLKEHFFGLLVDSVVQVLDIPLSRIEPPPEIVGGVEGEYCRGIGRVDDRLIILLNLQKILAVDEDISGGLEESAFDQTDLPG